MRSAAAGHSSRLHWGAGRSTGQAPREAALDKRVTLRTRSVDGGHTRSGPEKQEGGAGSRGEAAGTVSGPG